VGRPQVFEWFSKFRNGVMYAEDAECHGMHWQVKQWKCARNEGTCPSTQKNHFLWTC